MSKSKAPSLHKFIHFFLLVVSVLSHPAVHEPIKTGVNKYVVDDLPGLGKISTVLKPQMYAGHINIHESNHTNYFFWKFEQKLQNTDVHDTDKIVIWLNGGPGCSSMDGALMEIGPLRLNSDGEVFFNNGTWLESATLVFLDQPVGTGFSYGDNYHSELTSVTFDFMIFLRKYFELFPNDRSKKLYIAGESYAGQYMPYFAKYILDHNEVAKKNDRYNLKSILIGNGWISASYTGLSYIPFATEAGLITGKEESMSKVYKQQEECQNGINKLKSDDSQAAKNLVAHSCDIILNKLLDVIKVNGENQCINMYDIRLSDTYPSCGMNWPPDLPFLYKFLSDSKVQQRLNLNSEFVEKEKSDPNNPHVGQTYWKECNNRVGSVLTNANSVSAEEIMPEVIERLPVLLFNGDKDIICNYIGAENFIRDLTWNGETGFTKNAEIKDWFYNDTLAGTIQHERNLTYIKVYNTSHMVPFDSPDLSRGILDYSIENFHVEKKAVNGVEKDVVVTPLYNISSSSYYYIHILNKSKGHFYEEYFHFRYFLYLVILGVILYGLFYYNSKSVSQKMPASILTRNGQNSDPLSNAGAAVLSGIGFQHSRAPAKKKSVQWADQQAPERPELALSPDSLDLPDQYDRPFTDEDDELGTTTRGASASRKFNNFLDKFGLSKPFKDSVKYHRASNMDAEEEIEMVNNLDRLPRNNSFKLDDNDDFEVSDEEDLASGRNGAN